MLSTILSWLSEILDKITTQGLTAAAALAGAIAGPIVAFIIGSRQIKASIFTVNRQAWINSLRNDITELMSLRIEWSALHTPHPNGSDIICLDERRSDELVNRMRYLLFKIELSLNPAEASHAKLVSLLHIAPALPNNAQLNDDILGATQEILRTEWKRATRSK